MAKGYRAGKETKDFLRHGFRTNRMSIRLSDRGKKGIDEHKKSGIVKRDTFGL